jgi:hypothetical protein
MLSQIVLENRVNDVYCRVERLFFGKYLFLVGQVDFDVVLVCESNAGEFEEVMNPFSY